jgi:predicted RNA methylase
MERFPQFSTPLPMSFEALAAAQITARDLVLELSAGPGMLAILAEIAGGSRKTALQRKKSRSM